MADPRNTVKVFVLANSEPVRRQLLRIIDDIPVAELVGVAGDECVNAHQLSKLQPDLLFVNLESPKSCGNKLFGQLSRQFPQCKTIMLSKPSPQTWPSASDGTAAGADRTVGYVDPDDHTRIRTEIQKTIAAKHKDKPTAGTDVAGGPGGRLYEYVSHAPDRASSEPSPGVVSNMIERRRRQTGRRRSELDPSASLTRFQSFVEQLPGLPYVASLSGDGIVLYVSPRIEEVLGFSQSEWCADPGLRGRQLHPEDRERVLATINEALADRQSYQLDYRIYAKDGSLRWVHDEARILTDQHGTPSYAQGTMLDITERKQAQADLERSHGELQELISALDSMRVEEQRRLAHEMHDDFGQLLVAMKTDLGILQEHLPKGDTESIRYLNSINELVDTMVTSVRRIIADLPPKLVEDLGLFSALTSLVRNVEKHHRIRCRMHLPEDEPALSTRAATALYRMAQEALNNVTKHADASQAELRIEYDSTSLLLIIVDNGKGLSEDCLHKPGSFGLIGMRERAASLGGEMRIEPGPSQGTAVRIAIPLGSS